MAPGRPLQPGAMTALPSALPTALLRGPMCALLAAAGLLAGAGARLLLRRLRRGARVPPPVVRARGCARVGRGRCRRRGGRRARAVAAGAARAGLARGRGRCGRRSAPPPAGRADPARAAAGAAVARAARPRGGAARGWWVRWWRSRRTPRCTSPRRRRWERATSSWPRRSARCSPGRRGRRWSLGGVLAAIFSGALAVVLLAVAGPARCVLPHGPSMLAGRPARGRCRGTGSVSRGAACRAGG